MVAFIPNIGEKYGSEKLRQNSISLLQNNFKVFSGGL